MLPTAAATKAGHALDVLDATNAAMADAGAIVTTATKHPASHRPKTICQIGAGESHVKWNVPARTSAPRIESPMTSAAIGIIRLRMPSQAMLAKARSRLDTDWLMSPKKIAPAHGNSRDAQRVSGQQ